MKRLLAPLLLIPLAALAERPSDFAYGIAVKPASGDALVQIDLPQAVYETVVRADLGDLRVFNAAGEPVPHAFRQRVTSTRREATAVQVPLFPIRGEPGMSLEGMDVRIQRQGDRTVLDLRAPGGKRATTSARLVGYVADASVIEKPLRAVMLQLAPSAENIIAKATVEASDDLRHWQTVARDAAVVRFESGGQRLEQLRIEFPARKAKYLRLSWPARDRPIELRSFAVEPGAAVIETERKWKQIAATSVKGKPNEHELDLGGQFPVDRIRIALPHPNTIASIELASRAKAADPWRRVTATTVYRLNRDGDEAKRPDIAVATNADRHWLLRVDERGGGIGSAAPMFQVGWVPHRLIFAARGAPPFVLAYGSRDVQPAAYPIATLVPDYKDDEALDAEAARIGSSRIALARGALAEPRSLAGDGALRERMDWKRWLLWGSLVFSVSLLGWMALNLGRQMAKPASAARSDPTRSE